MDTIGGTIGTHIIPVIALVLAMIAASPFITDATIKPETYAISALFGSLALVLAIVALRTSPENLLNVVGAAAAMAFFVLDKRYKDKKWYQWAVSGFIAASLVAVFFMYRAGAFD